MQGHPDILPVDEDTEIADQFTYISTKRKWGPDAILKVGNNGGRIGGGDGAPGGTADTASDPHERPQLPGCPVPWHGGTSGTEATSVERMVDESNLRRVANA